MRYVFQTLFVIVLQLISTNVSAQSDRQVLDDFENIGPWAPFPADGVKLELSSDTGLHGKALRMDFGFTGGGYAVARRKLDVDLPENYAFQFQLRADAPVNHLEFKLLDESGENVWWYVRRDMTFPRSWTPLKTKKRQISFAWGPKPGELKHVAAVEIVVTAGTGGTGTVWVDDLELVTLPPPGGVPPVPVATANSAATGHPASLSVDGDTTTAWQPAPGDRHLELTLDLGQPREFGGLTIDWLPRRHASRYRLEGADDARTWSLLAEVEGSNGGRDYFLLPESEFRYLRIRPYQLGRGVDAPPIGLAEITLRPLEFGASRENFFGTIAREAPRGSYPRAMIGEPAYWTVVGPDDSPDELLFSADGAIEVGKQGASVEPFLEIDGRLISWAQADIRQDRVDELPVPRVTWEADDVRLTITPFDHGRDQVAVRYRLSNMGATPHRIRLHLAARPFQVNPPAQFLNVSGGTARVSTISQEDNAVRARIDGPAPNRSANVFRVGDHYFTADRADIKVLGFHQGDVVADWLWHGRRPDTTFGSAYDASSLLLSHAERTLSPGDSAEIDLAIALPSARVPREALIPLGSEPRPDSTADRTMAAFQDSSLARWRARIGPVRVTAPPAAGPLLESKRAQVGYILVNRAGPAIQPGTRAYARSWIRDGSLTSSALLRTGHAAAVREFLEWYAPHQYANGKIPCVVDWRGADPVPEHDSSGEFIFLVAEYFRYTGDRTLAEAMWPRVARAAAYLDSLRHERRTEEWRSPDRIEFYGLLPPSISHEGYSAKPMHSYWDDSFAYKGFTDAAWLAERLGHRAEARRWSKVATEFGQDLAASIAAAQRRHAIAYVPGCADLGDFDATSTTTFLSPTGASSVVLRTALEATFEQYWKNFVERRNGAPWEAFTPYEVRNIGAFIRLGWRDRAQELADWFLRYQKPVGWRQWPEVVWNDESQQKFLGDLPHTWVGSDFARSVLDMFAYVREDERALVLAAGVPSTWLDDPGVAVDRLPTPWGELSYRLTRSPGNSGRLALAIDGLRTLPPDGLVVRAPGCPDAVVRKLPARLELSPSR
jgi:hypothetical protein